MATLVNDGDINASGNWQVCSQIKTLHASTNLTVSDATGQTSATWNGNGATVHRGVLIFIASISGTPTITVALQKLNGSWADVASTTLVVTSATKTGCWYYFKFAATATEASGTNNYRIKVYRSAGTTNITVRADNAATSNVGIVCVTNATATLAVGDRQIVCGITQAATGNPTAATVTMNINDSTTIYGDLTVANGGTFQWANVALATYYIKRDGAANINVTPGYAIWVQNGGTYNLAGGTATMSTLDIAATAERLIQIDNGGTFTVNGKSLTGSVFRTTTTANVTGGVSTSVTVAANVQTAGWKANDYITLSCTAAKGQTERVQIASVSGTTINFTAAPTNNHASGCEVVHLSRNVRIRQSGASTARMVTNPGGSLTLNWCEIGDSTTGGNGLTTTATSTAGILHPLSATSISTPFDSDGMVMIGCGGTTGSGTGAIFFGTQPSLASMSNLAIYNSLGTGLISLPVSLTNASIYGCSTASAYGIYMAGRSYQPANRVTGVHCYDYSGSSSSGVILAATARARLYFVNCKNWANAYGVLVTVSDCNAVFINSSFGSDGTNTVANTTADIGWTQTTYIGGRLRLYNCKYYSSTYFSAISTATWYETWRESGVFSHRHQGVAGRHRLDTLNGIISDQITGGQAASWARGGSGTCIYFDPKSSTAGYTLNGELYVPVTAGQSTTISFYVKTTQTASGPTLSYTVFDSHDDETALLGPTSVDLTGASDWVQVTTPAFVPTDTGFCRIMFATLDGSSTGDVGIDDLSVSPFANPSLGDQTRWMDGYPAPIQHGPLSLPDAKYLYNSIDRGDGVTGTLRASNLHSGAGAPGVDLSAGILQDGVTVDDVAGNYDPVTGNYTDPGKANVLVSHDYYFAGAEQVAEYSPDFPAVGNVRDTDTVNGVPGTLSSNKILKSNPTGAGNYNDDNLSVGNVRPVAFGLSQTGDLSNLVATDAAYVSLENSRNNDNGTVAADLTTDNSVKIRNVTINGSLDLSLYFLIPTPAEDDPLLNLTDAVVAYLEGVADSLAVDGVAPFSVAWKDNPLITLADENRTACTVWVTDWAEAHEPAGAGKGLPVYDATLLITVQRKLAKGENAENVCREASEVVSQIVAACCTDITHLPFGDDDSVTCVRTEREHARDPVRWNQDGLFRAEILTYWRGGD